MYCDEMATNPLLATQLDLPPGEFQFKFISDNLFK